MRALAKIFVGIFLLTLLLGTTAFAQTDDTQPAAAPTAVSDAKAPATSAFNMAAAPKPQGGSAGRTFDARRFELTIQFGGAVGGNLGELDLGNCVSATIVNGLDGCDPNQELTHEDDGIYPGRLGGIRSFQRYGGVTPGSGGFGGVRFGINMNPRWQVELIYNYANNSVEFTNKGIMDAAVGSFIGSGFGADPRTLRFVDGRDGTPSGSQHQFLININRNFNAGSRVVPYIGAGAGMVHWMNMPSVQIETHTSETGDDLAHMTKSVDSSTGFAFDLAAGAKVYITNSVGFRFDYMSVFSFPQLTQTFQSIDVNDFQGNGAGALYALSGTVEQRGRFHQGMFSGGIFWAFGDSVGTDNANMGTMADRDSMNDKWEFAATFGGTRGSAFGDTDDVTCTEAVADGCNLGLPVDIGNGNGVFETKLGGILPGFMASGGVRPSDGWNLGFRLGYNFTPNWQFAFIFNHVGAGLKFTNYNQVEQSLSAFYSGQADTSPRDLVIVGGEDGTPRGTQQQFLFNINYNFSPNRAIVPYVGIGAGAVRWSEGPSLNLHQDITGGGGGIADFTKVSGDSTGFAVDFAAGVKFYTTRHFGFRIDMTNVISWASFDHVFTSIDTDGTFTGVAGTVVPMSGVLRQDRRAFNQLSGSGGVFWTF